jgi:hypothetical protein
MVVFSTVRSCFQTDAASVRTYLQMNKMGLMQNIHALIAAIASSNHLQRKTMKEEQC